MWKVILFSDNTLMACLLGNYLVKQHPDITVVIESNRSELECLTGDSDGTALLIDAGAKEALDVTLAYSGASGLPCVVFGLRKEPETVMAYATAGAQGLVLRDADVAQIEPALTAVAEGGCSCCEWITKVLMRSMSHRQSCRSVPTGKFTPRESEVAQLLDAGHSNKEIARRLSIEVTTAKNHVHNVLQKLNVTSRAKAVVELRRIGIV